jgi:hypothetical protein
MYLHPAVVDGFAFGFFPIVYSHENKNRDEAKDPHRQYPNNGIIPSHLIPYKSNTNGAY